MNNETNKPKTVEEVVAQLEKMPVTVEICGDWVWVSGKTRPHKKALKGMGLWWASRKQMWYWRPDDAKVFSKGHVSMGYIRTKYGSQTVKEEEATA